MVFSPSTPPADTPLPTVYVGTFIHCPTPGELGVLPAHAVFVTASGHIAAMHALPAETIASTRTDAEVEAALPTEPGFSPHHTVRADAGCSEFFFPGLVDTHIHASQYPNNGVFGASTLLDWLERYTFPLEASLADLHKARAVYARCIARTLAAGTTTAAYYATRDAGSTNLLATMCAAFGQRALVGRCAMDRLSPDYYVDADVDSSIEDTRRCIAHCASLAADGTRPGLVTPVITPRFAPSCSAELLAGLGALAAETGLPVQTHISENAGEITLVKQLFPGTAHYADVYDRAGLLTERTILAHAVHLSAEEVALVATRGAKVSHCPVSNMCLQSGMAPVKRLVRAGIDIGLGTDVSGGYAPSVLVAARQAALTARMVALEQRCDDDIVSVPEALYLATRGGAKVVGLGDRVGAFEVGMEWDALLVGLGPSHASEHAALNLDDGPVDLFGWESWDEKIAKWVYTGDERNTLGVWVAGRRVYEKDGSTGRFVVR